MPARTPEGAVEAFLEPLRQAALCITPQPLLATGYRPATQPHTVAFAPRGQAVPLRSASGPRGIALFVSQRYAVEAVERDHEPWSASSIAYRYDLLDRDGREILTYHWHPDDAGPAFPHLHISGRIGELHVGEGLPPVALGDMHLPTEQIAFAARSGC